MRLRQVALVARDLEATTSRLGRLLGLDYGYHDPGIIKFGLDNWVAAIGDTYLEVVSPVQDDTTAGRFLDRRGGDGGYMVILQVDDLERAKAQIEAAGARIVWHARGEGQTGEPDEGHTTEGLHVHPRDCGGAILSVDQSTPTDAWVWAGPEWPKHGSSFLSGICGVEIEARDPGAMAKRWTDLLAVASCEGTTPDGRPTWRIDFGTDRDGHVRFVRSEDSAVEGVSAFDVRVENKEALERATEAAGIELHRSLSSDFEARYVDEAGVRVFFV